MVITIKQKILKVHTILWYSNTMLDYKKTEELFKAQGISHFYKRPQGQLDDELFYAKVTNPTTGTFYKLSDLLLEYRQTRQDKQYPIREVLQIIRIKRKDGNEWLKSRGRIIGLDMLGNEVEHSFTDPEVFFTQLPDMSLSQKTQRITIVQKKGYVWKLE